MLLCVVGQVVPVIFKEHSAFIVKDQAGQENCLTLKVKALQSFELLDQ
jgi:hypothetical protein